MNDDPIYTRTRKRKSNYIEKEKSKKLKNDKSEEDNVEQSELSEFEQSKSDEEFIEEIEEQMSYDPDDLPLNKITTFVTLFRLCNIPKMTTDEQKNTRI